MSQENALLADLHGLVPERKPRLLLVDDQAINIQVMHRVFAQDCQVFMATSGTQAIRICEEQSPDLVLLDIEMPGMDGFEVCRRLKAHELTRHIPVIFVTAHADPAQETQGLELGAVDFIAKPINPPVLRARARTQLLLKFQSDVLRDLVYIDGLTTLFNRRYFDQQFDMEWSRSTRQDTELSLILLDVDFFKRYNDHYGHQLGDECLREIGRVLKGSLRRATDVVARYGGEEFVCLLPDTPHDQAMKLARGDRGAGTRPRHAACHVRRRRGRHREPGGRQRPWLHGPVAGTAGPGRPAALPRQDRGPGARLRSGTQQALTATDPGRGVAALNPCPR
jgi:PleD family two-component response regulator